MVNYWVVFSKKPNKVVARFPKKSQAQKFLKSRQLKIIKRRFD